MQSLSTLQQQHYSHANQCYICKRSFNPFDGDNNNRKVRDHCHLTGDFRCAAHSMCNLNLRIDPEKVRIPVVSHNLKGYDSHIILENIKKHYGNVEVIPNNTEKYTSFSFGGATFIDSFQFMPASLDNLAKNLNDKSNFKNVRRFLESHLICNNEEEDEEKDEIVVEVEEEDADQEIDNKSDYRNSPYHPPNLNTEQKNAVDEDMNLLIRKGVYPYEYITDVDKLRETRFPPKEAFKSTLKLETISQSDYDHAIKVFEHFGIIDLMDYTNLYVTTGVLILSDVF